MRTLYPYIFNIICILGMNSCSELLDVDAENTISGEILTDAESIQRALNGAYYNFSGISSGFDGGELIGGDFILIPELLARISPNGAPPEYLWESVNAPLSYLDFKNKEILATNDRVAANWRRAYETINQANQILTVLDKINDPNERNRIHGEALAMRGILYYEMVLLWAPDYNDPDTEPSTERAIPVFTEPILDVTEIPQLSESDVATIEQVYIQAETDLLDASELLEPFEKNGTNLSYYACEAYLAKLYLQSGDFVEARTHASNVISSGAYQLADTPMEAFNNSQNSTEDIFAIQQTLANNTGDRSSGIGVTAYFSSLVESGLGTFAVLENPLDNDEFYNSPHFSAQDLRSTINANVDENTTSNEINTAFYISLADNLDELLSSGKFTSTSNVLPIIRLAEMYLIRSEAEFFSQNEVITQSAVDDLNAIRTRANLDALAIGDFANSDAFFDSLALERTREFMQEGMLLEDLKRWGGFIGRNTSVTYTYDPWDDEFVLPIPQSETDTWDGN